MKRLETVDYLQTKICEWSKEDGFQVKLMSAFRWHMQNDCCCWQPYNSSTEIKCFQRDLAKRAAQSVTDRNKYSWHTELNIQIVQNNVSRRCVKSKSPGPSPSASSRLRLQFLFTSSSGSKVIKAVCQFAQMFQAQAGLIKIGIYVLSEAHEKTTAKVRDQLWLML